MKKENLTQQDRLMSAVRREYHRRDAAELLPELLDDRQLARALGSTPRQIRAWRQKRIIPSIKISYRTIRFRLSMVLAALEERSIKARR